MELTYNELKKRDVINIADGVCLGRITNLKLQFPQGVLKGIFVPGRKSCHIFRFLNRNDIFIEDKKIVKIGSDVILVNLKCGESVKEFSSYSSKSESKQNCSPCPPQHQPCPPQNQPCSPNQQASISPLSCENLFGDCNDDRYDLSDY